MTTPDMPKSPDRIITDETFTKLRDAANNLFRFGPYTEQKVPVFGTLRIEEGKVSTFEEKKLTDRPSHIYSGKIDFNFGMDTTLEVWKMFEGGRKIMGAVNDNQNVQSIVPARVVREDIMRDESLYDRTDYIIADDGRAYELVSTLWPDFRQVQISREMHDKLALLVTYWMEDKIAVLAGTDSLDFDD